MKHISLNDISLRPTSHGSKIQKKVMIGNGEIPNIVGFAQTYIPPDQRVERHVHQDKFEVFLIEEGEGTIMINDSPYKIKKGDYFRLDPGDAHEIIPSGKSPLVITYFGVKS